MEELIARLLEKKDDPALIPGLEQLALQIPADHRTTTAETMATCWFDYRELHPVIKTYMFAEEYRKTARMFYAMYVDAETASSVNGFSPDDIFKSTDRAAMWKARELVDSLGIPYTFALLFAKQWAYERGIKRWLRPNQLYSEELEVDLRNAWSAKVKTILTFSQDARYKTDPGADIIRDGPSFVNEHRAFIVCQVRARAGAGRIDHLLVARLLSERLLTKGEVEAEFGKDVQERASKLSQH